MKKIKFLFALLAIVSSINFISCKNSDDGNTPTFKAVTYIDSEDKTNFYIYIPEKNYYYELLLDFRKSEAAYNIGSSKWECTTFNSIYMKKDETTQFSDTEKEGFLQTSTEGILLKAPNQGNSIIYLADLNATSYYQWGNNDPAKEIIGFGFIYIPYRTEGEDIYITIGGI